MMSKGVFAAVLYGSLSVVLIMFNKAVLSVYNFRYELLIAVAQSLFSLFMLSFLKFFNFVQYPNFTLSNAKKFFPLSMLYVAFVFTGLTSMAGVNIPMYTTLRRLTIIFVMLLEYLIQKKLPSPKVRMTVATMVFGSIVAGMYDLNFDPYCYMVVFLCNFFTALYLVSVNAKSKELNLNEWSVLYYNNLIGLPFFAFAALIKGEYSSVVYYTHRGDFGFQVAFFFSVVLAFALNFSIILSTSINSALTQTVTGQVKNFLSLVAGIIFFSDFRYQFVNALGVTISTAGAVWYAVVKYEEGQRRQKA